MVREGVPNTRNLALEAPRPGKLRFDRFQIGVLLWFVRKLRK